MAVITHATLLALFQAVMSELRSGGITLDAARDRLTYLETRARQSGLPFRAPSIAALSAQRKRTEVGEDTADAESDEESSESSESESED